MDITLIISIVSIVAVLASAAGALLNGLFVSDRLQIEKRLTSKLAKIICDENLEVQLKLAAGKIQVAATYSTNKSTEEAVIEVRQKIFKALNEMPNKDNETILSIINQPSKKGQMHYIKRVANKTLASIEAQIA